MGNDKNKKGIKLDDSTLEDVNSSLYNFDFDDENDEKDFYEYDENKLNDFRPIGAVDNEYYESLFSKREKKTSNIYNKSKTKSIEDKMNESVNVDYDNEIISINSQSNKQKDNLKDEILNIINNNQPSKNKSIDNKKIENEEITIFEKNDELKNVEVNELNDNELKSLMESAFYVYGGDGLSLSDLKRLTLCPVSSIKRILDKWIKELESDDSRGLTIKMFGEKYKFFTKEKNREQLSRLITVKYKNPLSQKVMETLAIIAYNQPCTKSIIEDIRGKDPTQVIMKLIDLGLVNEAGRSSGPGRPLLFTVTPKFYDIFGIKNLADLPTINLDQPFQDDDVSFFDTTRFND